ncbi:MAG: hypothetical protein L6W00_28710 [Lentisphaeria bacterium]|nr:MAG: hypothetical protein L6W00_28710 [Lentisphaeria bacterium]
MIHRQEDHLDIEPGAVAERRINTAGYARTAGNGAKLIRNPFDERFQRGVAKLRGGVADNRPAGAAAAAGIRRHFKTARNDFHDAGYRLPGADGAADAAEEFVGGMEPGERRLRIVLNVH